MPNQCERILGIGGGMDFVSSLLHVKSQAAPHQGVIIYKQDRSSHWDSLHLIALW
jgi:hypothetical protein